MAHSAAAGGAYRIEVAQAKGWLCLAWVGRSRDPSTQRLAIARSVALAKIEPRARVCKSAPTDNWHSAFIRQRALPHQIKGQSPRVPNRRTDPNLAAPIGMARPGHLPGGFHL